VAGLGGIAAVMEPDHHDYRSHRDEQLAEARAAAERARREYDKARRAQEMVRKLRDQLRPLSELRFEVQAPEVAQAGVPENTERGDGVDAVAQLDALTQEMCKCSDEPCADAVSERIDHWGRDMATQVPWGKRSVMKHIAELSQRNIVCLTRIAAGFPGEAAEAPKVEVWTNQPPGYKPGTPAQAPAEQPPQ
jgi:hypothetical protein